jgi:6-phosphogluconolactonase
VFAAAFSLAASLPAFRAADHADYLMYVGTGSRDPGKGIYAFRFEATGRATSLGLAAEARSPNFLAIHPSRKLLYAVASAGSPNAGAVSAYAIDRGTGKLALLNTAASRGSGPCFVAVDRTGKNVLVAHYGVGSVASMPIATDGRVGEPTAVVEHHGSSVNRERQKEPHAHSINVSSDNRFAVAADLGTDRLEVYRFDAARGTLVPNEPAFATVPPGSGPRHFSFHPGGKFAYVINELGSTVTAFAYDAARGVLTPIQTITTLPAGFQGTNYPAEVLVHPSGKFLYGSNRGHDSIAVFAIDPAKGTLTAVEHVSTQGKWPRNFGIDPSGGYLAVANANSGNVVIFKIAARTGGLKPTGQTFEVPEPLCVRFVE